MTYSAYRRTNERDVPTPPTIKHEWIVCKDALWIGGVGLAWPDTPEGQKLAEGVAALLNNAQEEGRRSVVEGFKELMGLTGL